MYGNKMRNSPVMHCHGITRHYQQSVMRQPRMALSRGKTSSPFSLARPPYVVVRDVLMYGHWSSHGLESIFGCIATIHVGHCLSLPDKNACYRCFVNDSALPRVTERYRLVTCRNAINHKMDGNLVTARYRSLPLHYHAQQERVSKPRVTRHYRRLSC